MTRMMAMGLLALAMLGGCVAVPNGGPRQDWGNWGDARRGEQREDRRDARQDDRRDDRNDDRHHNRGDDRRD